ncbi:MAG: heme ABC transporter permease CcmB [Candidatus Kapabacteria bacterium]|nr:heme ABC transporter permease CcmB [Candidatus Kapabacteria bacterium]
MSMQDVSPLRSSFTRLYAVIEKDIRSEVRTRFGITALLLFVVTSVVLVVFSVTDEPLPKPLMAALLWVLMFFTAMTGLGRGFVREEERGTTLLLRLSATSTTILVGKLLVNVVLALVANLLTVVLFLFFLPRLSVGNMSSLLAVVSVGSAGFAATLTVVSAIVAKAGSTQALLPVLSFPVLLPLVMPGTNAMLMALAGFSIAECAGDLTIMAGYTAVVCIVAWMVFDLIWHD